MPGAYGREFLLNSVPFPEGQNLGGTPLGTKELASVIFFVDPPRVNTQAPEGLNTLPASTVIPPNTHTLCFPQSTPPEDPS